MDSDGGSPHSPGPGGFVPEQPGAAPSPNPAPAFNNNSNNNTSPALARTAADLPHPRRRALPPGSAKENLVRRYVSDRILNISRRFIKKYAITDPADTVVGYRSMGELCADVDVVLNSLWKSGTPNLQVQYLLNIGSEFITWMDGFAPSPRATLAILRKLDYCFASLLGGADLATGEPLPGFEKGVRRAGMTQTDMVRCRSIAEQSRITVVDVFQRGPPDPLDEGDHHRHWSRAPATPTTTTTTNTTTFRESTVDTETTDTDAMETDTGDTETETETVTRETTAEPGTDDMQDPDPDPEQDFDSDSDSDLDEDERMSVAQVYEYTLVKLGEALGEGYGRIGNFAPLPQPSTSNNTCTSIDVDFGDNDDDEY